ncbi:nuclease-like protein [Homoserinimonas aerilata]|uniref:Nuclease-like protein n=1 Tax=Homoserinimonas aerilata TaxID=1162970 RepID=A0A542Y1I7_9MICO|nr:thermonuclease family protein [Homoserinimonas aerilata]TQL41942.1 nuclease-like protein [Homoserinimonas aerilata]
MKKLGLLLVVVVAVIVALTLANGGGAQLLGGGGPGATLSTGDSSGDTSGGAPVGGEASGTEPYDIVSPDGAETMTIDYVHDGDTLFAANANGERLKVRLIGLDTPEVGEHAECFGDEATARLRALLPEGSVVSVAHDAEPQDRYGRELLYLWASDGTFVNLSLVADGYGEALKVGANDQYWPQLQAAEADARAASAGLWAAC